MQSRLQSLIEAWVNVLVGYLVAVASQVLIFPLFGLVTSLGDNFLIAGYFTLISLLRSYWLRRFFNFKHSQKKANLK